MVKKPVIKGLGQKLFEAPAAAPAEHPVERLAEAGADRLVRIPVEAIRSNPEQPRKHFDDQALAELAGSIRERGLLQPILVRPDGERFVVLAGERRLRAAAMAGLTKIPAIVREGANALEIALIENLQREDLTPIEEAEALQQLVDKHGYTHEALAKVLGRSRTAITETLAIAKLPEEIKAQCRTSDNVPKAQLLQVVRQKSPEQMQALFEKVSSSRLTVRETRKLAKGKPVRRASPAAVVAKAAEQFAARVARLDLEGLAAKERKSLAENLRALVATLRELLKQL
jgi:ParB family chromosome partitioning protein